MKEITIAFWGETYKVKQGLTKKLDMPEWVIFYDKKSGLWSYNVKTKYVRWLNRKYISLNDPLLEHAIEWFRYIIRETEKFYGGRNEVTES